MTNTYKSLLAVHTAVLIFGLTALFSRWMTLSALDISLIRSIFAALVILVFIYWNKESIRLARLKDYFLVLFLGILLALHWVTYFHAMQVSSIAVGVIALYTFPVITVFLEPLFHGEKPQLADIISALAVLLGIYLIVPEFSMGNETTLGLLWGILSAFLFSLRNIVQSRYFRHYSARQSLFYQTLVTFLVLLPFSYQHIPAISAFQWGQLFILGLFFTALPHTLFTFSLLHFKAKVVSLVACLQVVYATVFAALLLGEYPGYLTVIGGLIVVLAAVYESYKTVKIKER